MGALNIAAAVVAFSTLCLFAVNGYEIVYPFKANDNGNKREFSTNVDGKHQDNVAFVVKRESGEMVLDLKRNIGFHANKVLMRTFDDDGNARTEMHSPDSCYYSGKLADKEDSYVLLDSCNGLRGSIEDGEKRYNLEPLEGRESDGAHKLYEVEKEDENLLKRALAVNPLHKDYIETQAKQNDAYDAYSDNESDETMQSALLPDVDPIYAKYPSTNKTRYCEMFLVIDHEIYVRYNRNKTLLFSRMLSMIHAVDRSYAAINIRVVLVAIEIWTDQNKVPYNISDGIQLKTFTNYRNANLLGVIRHDIAHYMSSKSWAGGVIGLAYMNGICSKTIGTSINVWSFHSITGTNTVVAHELGHNMGLPHDAAYCKCPTTRGCLMGGPESRRPGFTDCNMKVFSDPNRSYECLNNYPLGSLGTFCGNGIIEGSEECDCGTPELCKKKDSCCEPHGCKLKRSAQCSDFNNPDCCQNCLFKKQGTLCREAQNNCDLPEYCAGNSGTCSVDVYKKDGTICSDINSGSSSYCYNGRCPKTLDTQCKDLWDAGANSANNSCWNKLNTEANGFGTCDPAKNQTCAQKDIFCGQLQCTSSKLKPEKVNYGTVYKEIMLNGVKCSAASITISGTSNDQVGNGIGMVAFGTKCGDGKMCSGYSCKSISELNIKQCPKVNGIECAGRGACNNNGKCHCSEGYDPITNCTTALIAVDGSWGQWTDWSKCTAACNGGMKQRPRFCDAPFPAHGGSDCVGAAKEEEQCNTDACPNAKSCKLLMKKLKDSGKPMVDGVYDITMADGTIMKMYCDMTRDGGGWTLVVTGHTNLWNTSDMVREWNKDKPTLWNDYSILKYVDQIKDNFNIDDDHFEYRLDAQARGRWGGIWSAPISYKFDTFSSVQTKVKLTKKFDDWTLGTNGVANRMPHIIQNWLTTQTKAKDWGSITGDDKDFHPSKWMRGELKEAKPEYIWYWLREGHYKSPTSCAEIRLRALLRGKKPESGLYEIQTPGGKILNVICNMDSSGGGWTLVLNKMSSAGWTLATTLSRNENKPSKSNDYSILSHLKDIASKQEESTFQYMLEAEGSERWGGIFEARIQDAMTTSSSDTKEPKLLKKFDNWDETKCNLAKRLPYLLDNPTSYLTTENTASNGEDGVIVSSTSSIYIKGSKEKPSFIRMWVRESASKRSCNEIKTNGERHGVVYKDGLYTAKKLGADIHTLYCDMTSDRGAWTLLVTSVHGNWTKDQVLSRNKDFPSTIYDYSILDIADSIKDISNNATFKYKMDAKEFNHWGGIWEAPIEYTFLSKSNAQNDVTMLKQFDQYDTGINLNQRMPWLGQTKGILTTSGVSDSGWWGTIISDNLEYNPAPWISGKMAHPGVIWYWINEDDCSADRQPVDAKFTEWSEWTPCSVYCGQGTTTRFRDCVKPRCGGAPCDTAAVTDENKQCTGKCLSTPIRSYDSQYCLLPTTGSCNITDETLVAWQSGIDKCSLPEAEYIVDLEHGSIIHKCSGKPVCPKGGEAAHWVNVVISSKCPAMKPKRKFTRTMYTTLHFGDICIHTTGGSPGDGHTLTLWSGCENEKHKMLFYKLETGPVHAKMWKSVVNTKGTINDLLNDVRFPNNPTSTGVLDNFDSPYNIGNNYGILLWTYFKAPETGMYTFHSACDDTCQIFLSTTDKEADKQKIVDQKGWCSQYEYNRRSDQKSKKISLIAGNLYYLEGILYEIGGGDHLSLAVDLPSGLRLAPITNFYLRGKI